MNAQLKKGILELCVLALLERQDCYGFELVCLITQHVAMSEGTVYPLLKRLRDEGLLTTYLVESREGAPRKYYRIMPPGIERLRGLQGEWSALCNGVNKLLEGRD